MFKLSILKKNMEFPFDGTVFGEKILRVQPNMKKLLLLLLRAADTESATVLLLSQPQYAYVIRYTYLPNSIRRAKEIVSANFTVPSFLSL